METNHIKDGSEHTPSSEDLSKEDDESKKDLIYSEDELLQINQRISLRVYDDESKEFTSLTTYHGMVRIYNSATWPSLIFWCLVVVTCVTLFMIHCGLLLTYYNSHPTFIKETLYNRAHMDVSPTITICKRYFQDPKKVKEYNVTKVAAFFLRGVVAKEFIITNYPAEYREWASYEEQFKERNGFNFSISQYLLDTSKLEPVLANETASIKINWQHSMTKIQRQSKKITAVDLLSLVAGSMGLFLGMSCVTLLEIFMYLFKSVWGMINNARHKSYLESTIGEKVSHYIKHPNEREGSYESIVITHQTPIHASDKNCNVPKI
uniref:Amiloride-sensitive sodium channel subunit gamma n=1 Tax=Rhabditophanes sp. KR3021 TaxID=114890 RepID=A0AC35UCB5_9BILA